MANRLAHNLPDGFPPLMIEVQAGRVSQVGLLEAMRLGAGLTYKQLAVAAQIPAGRIEKLLGTTRAAPRDYELARLLQVLWDRLPARPLPRLVVSSDNELDRLTVFQVAELLRLTPNAVRKAAPLLGGKLGGHLVFSRQRILAHVASRCGFIPTGTDDWLTIREAAVLLQMHPQAVRRAIVREQLPAFRLGHGRYHIPRCLAIAFERSRRRRA